MRKFRERARHREALAIQEGADLFDLLMADPIKENEDIDGACVVYIRGPLEHHACPYGDSYEQIRVRFSDALESGSERVILRIDSPGGVVSGLNQCVYDLTRMKEEAGVDVVVYVDELCASAAYALACVADEIVIPPAGIAGSIGVISTMVSQVGADKKDGLDFVTITSGARKADGHPHVAISEDAVNEEKKRVRELASQFFAIVKRARGIDAKALEAAIFTGQDAVDYGVADAVLGWEEMLAKFGLAQSEKSVSRSTSNAGVSDATGAKTMLRLQALIEKTRTSLKAEKNAAKRKALQAKLSGYQATLSDLEAAKKTYKKSTHVEETEEDEPKDEDEESDDKDEKEEDEPSDDKDKDKDEESAEFPDKKDEKKSKKAAKASDEDEESDDKEEESAEMDEEEEKALRAAVRTLKGSARAKAEGALRAVLEKARRSDTQDATLASLQRDKIQRDKETLISAKLAGGFITKKTAAELRGKKLAFVKPYLAMQKNRLFNREDEALVPSEDRPGGGDAHSFTETQERMFASAAAASNGLVTVESLKEQFLKGTKPNGVSQNPTVVRNGQLVPKAGY